MPNQQELEQAFKELDAKIGKIKEKTTEIDLQIKNTTANNMEKVEANLAELRNRYYGIQARELLGEFDAKQKREIEEKIQAAEKRLRTDGDRLQNLVGIRHALEAELKKTQAMMPLYQAALERCEFEKLKEVRQKLVEDIRGFAKQLESLFGKVNSYNLDSVALATRIIDREYQLKGFPNASNSNGDGIEKAHQLAQPFDFNHIKNTLTDALSEIISKSLTH